MRIDYEQIESLRSIAEKADIHSRVFSFNVTAYRLWQDIARAAHREAVEIIDKANDESASAAKAKVPVVRWTEFWFGQRIDYLIAISTLGTAFEFDIPSMYGSELSKIFDRPAVTYTKEK